MNTKEKLQLYFSEAILWNLTERDSSIFIILLEIYFAGLQLPDTDSKHTTKVLHACNTNSDTKLLQQILDQIPTTVSKNKDDMPPIAQLMAIFTSTIEASETGPDMDCLFTLLASGIRSYNPKSPYILQCVKDFKSHASIDDRFIVSRLTQYLDGTHTDNPVVDFLKFTYPNDPIGPYLIACAKEHLQQLEGNENKFDPDLWFIFGFDAALDLTETQRKPILAHLDPTWAKTARAIVQKNAKQLTDATDQQLTACLRASVPTANFTQPKDHMPSLGETVRRATFAMHYSLVVGCMLAEYQSTATGQ